MRKYSVLRGTLKSAISKKSFFSEMHDFECKNFSKKHEFE